MPDEDVSTLNSRIDERLRLRGEGARAGQDWSHSLNAFEELRRTMTEDEHLKFAEVRWDAHAPGEAHHERWGELSSLEIRCLAFLEATAG